MNKKVKIIFHIDLNAFFASVEMILDPYLKNKVFAVGGGASYFRGGVLTTASYRARRYGIRSGMNINEALKRYPRLIVVPNNHQAYRKYSKIFIDYLKTYTKTLYQASIDEAYLDVTDLASEIHPVKLAKKIQRELAKDYGLPSSIGIGPTLFLAKMGSDYKKPMGITIMRKRDVERLLYDKPINRVFGIGRKTNQRLNEVGIYTIEDFMLANNRQTIIEAIGENAYFSTRDDLLGRSTDFVDVNKYAIPKSISNETTLSYDVDILEVLKETIDELFTETYNRLKEEELMCKNVFIKIRYANFVTTTKTTSFINHRDDYDSLYYAVSELFEYYYDGSPIRLLGVGFGGIIKREDFKEDRTLFNYQQLDKKRTKLGS
ncbi:MAG: DNA polymerase IV [Acholeplasmataceae bacterium]|jgi:DNA polymerase-4|nr:DNA polymerase IV [Acholeplasmataceae bacterium]